MADSDVFRRFLHAEFPEEAHTLLTPIRRRDMLRLMGASLALAGVNACTKAPAEEIVPYVHAPEEFVPGRPLYFATAMSVGGFAKGVLVKSHLGRPTKVEGNPNHPASLGATDVFAQASVLTLYDPDRSQVVTHNGNVSTWKAFVGALEGGLADQRIKRGAGLRLLTERVTSPTLANQVRGLLAEFPLARWHQYEPLIHDNLRAGTQLAFGRVLHTRYRVDRADVIVSLDGDFLGNGPSNLRDARHFSDRRRPRAGQTMNRLYVVESTPSITGTVADHRVRVPAFSVERAAWSLARALIGHPAQSALFAEGHSLDPFLVAVGRDLLQHRGTSLVIAGDAQPGRVHALAHAMNAFLGNQGQTIEYTDPIEAESIAEMQSLTDLVADMKDGRVELLVIVGGNPVFGAPGDLPFGALLSRVALRVHLGLYEDETSQLCQWHVPEAHFLEAWSDARAFDGTTSIVQPLIAPLYDGKSSHELLAALSGQPGQAGYDIVREYWRGRVGAAAFDDHWQRSLNDGIVADTALPAKAASLITSLDALASGPFPEAPEGLEVVFRPDPTVWDGRFANNAWLQELPKPLTKLTWDGPALISPTTAGRLGLVSGDVVDLHYRAATMRVPVWILPGHADESITVSLGYGRTRGGRVASRVGVNGYLARTSDGPWFGRPVDIRKTGVRYDLASTQHHFSMEGRDFVRVGTFEQFLRNPRFATAAESQPLDSLYPGFAYRGHAWGLNVDLNACIGCGACVVACQAENNIPVVGKSEVARGRAMHWIRIDGYFEGDPADPNFLHQPVLCMHCENAPCELVCPVGATVHSEEGLNQMVYNRCVGTRYCSNNCPYKVRRFNFFQYADWDTPSLKGLRNPDVTVRSRGVMEKCTYCVQRINAAKIEAERAERPLRDGEIVTACQGVCPTQAIVFGDLNDRGSRVAACKDDPRNYGLLTELNTRPRTTYLARLRNPNPALTGGAGHGT
jgi:molybdopterin-containing oxidoreductase family iron-sulfur binding subunit